MAPLCSDVDAVKSAVSSVSTCSATAIVTLKGLLLPNDGPGPGCAAATSIRQTKVSKPTKQTTTAATKTPRKRKANEDGGKEELSARERAALATQVVNLSLKALGEAAKPASQSASKKPEDAGLVKAATRNALRRSNSMPMSPLQPRSLNRVSTSPVKTARPVSTVNTTSIDCRSTVECARVAFSALRTLNESGKISLPELQLEAGMSSFVGKLINLGLNDQAVKELRILKRRLDGGASVKNAKTMADNNKTSTSTLAELLDFSRANPSGPAMSLVVATQLQVLRILSAMKRPAHTTEALPVLRTSHPSSVITYLLSMANQTGADKGKLARQLEVVSQILLALSPSVSSSQDEFATNSSLNVSPEAAFELQGLGMEARMHWWRLAEHQGDLEKDILSPLSRCIAAYIRRVKGRSSSVYRLCVDTVNRVFELLPTSSNAAPTSTKPPQLTIYQMLATLARETGQFAEAVRWATKLKDSTPSEAESAAKLCSLAAQLLTLQLRLDPAKYLQDDTLLSSVLSGVQGSLRGGSIDLDELLGNVNGLRRTSIAILLGHVKDDEGTVIHPPATTKERLETFVLQCPRFVLRWLGKPPSPTSSTKDYLRYDQRRQLLLQSIHHTLDSAYVLAKMLLGEQRLSWDVLDTVLADSLMLLQYMGELPMPEGATSYHVKISHFYYMEYDFHRQERPGHLPDLSSAVKALRRSIDCIRSRPAKEREKAQLILKFERMAEHCRSLGKNEDVLGALQGIRDCLVDDGILAAVAAALETQHPRVAWSLTKDVDVLCRTLSSIAQLEARWVNWTTDFPEAHQAAVLEHRLHFVLLASKEMPNITLSDPTVDALLRIYIPTKSPIRRLRTLLLLLAAAVGDNDLYSDIRSIAADAVQQTGADDLGEDGPLACYLPHLKALYASIVGLADGYPATDVLEHTLGAWRDMIDSHPTREGLERYIDGVTPFLSHLESVADFLRLRGRQRQLDMVVRMSADISRIVQGPRPEQFVHSQTALALHLVDAGSADHAAEIFDAAEAFLRQSEDVPGHISAELQLAYAEFLITAGNPVEANDHLAKASTSFTSNRAAQKISRSRKKLLVGYAAYLHGITALELGSPEQALMYFRDSVRIMFSEWTRMESELTGRKHMEAATPDESTTTADMSATDVPIAATPVIAGPDFWTYFRHLFRATLRLSSMYAHIGMYQETTYYAQEAEKMAKATKSKLHIAQVTTWLASVYLKAGEHKKAKEMIAEARDALYTDYGSCSSLTVLCQMASVYRGVEDFEAETEILDMAERVLSTLKPNTENAMSVLETADLEKKMAKLDIKEKPAVRTTRRTVARAPAKRPAARAAAVKAKALTLPSAPVLPIEGPHMTTYRAAVLIQKALSFLGRKDWTAATSIIREAVVLPKHFPSSESRHVVMAACLLGQSLDDMARDSVFSVVHDSTLSFPTLAGPAHDRDRLSLTKHSPPRKGRGAATTGKKDPSCKDAVPSRFLLSLLEAQDILLGAHAEVATTGDGSLLHRISAMLQTVTLVLSTISARSKVVNHIGHAASSADLARNLTWRRERKVLLQERHAKKADGTEWPSAMSLADDSRRTSLGPVTDLAKFQREYVDIIPKSWTAISISLSENKHDLCITRLQAGHTPFVIRLPLERASSRDADMEVFNFQQGRAELLDIIKAANDTCHDKRDMSVKGAKAGWWADRAAIDTRMKALLENIERDWLGGFRGIFSQHQRRPDLLARFQKSFQNVLDKHLPSRRQVRGKKTRGAALTGTATTGPKMTLDSRILELFIGLGDATRDDCDFDDALTDLLYFVVDILQFHGERNAYDEVDFDAMVVETFDALQAYHAAAKAVEGSSSGAGVHTILVLDKALHAFPWESLPCMQDNAVSRVPSLACLRRMILEAQPSTASTPDTHPRAGHHIPLSSGTYIVDPSSNLPSTLATFAGPLQTHLPTFTSFVSRKPSEDDFSTALARSPLLLYFGHGSGAQYIRGRTVRRLDPGCRAVSLLWGCSSASLRDRGEFEAHGAAWNYLMAGCPALLGTLWDVTDRDIDRFAARTMEGWGLLPRGSVVVDDGKGGGAGKATTTKTSKGRKGGGGSGQGDGRGKASGAATAGWGTKTGEKMSLVEAVTAAREGACRFRYLTAAAVVVYGIPVYVDK